MANKRLIVVEWKGMLLDPFKMMLREIHEQPKIYYEILQSDRSKIQRSVELYEKNHIKVMFGCEDEAMRYMLKYNNGNIIKKMEKQCLQLV